MMAYINNEEFASDADDEDEEEDANDDYIVHGHLRLSSVKFTGGVIRLWQTKGM